MRVLLIEDDRSSARSVELMLAAEKFNVEIVADGEEGLDLAQTYDYDAVLLDLNLGDMSGLDVLRGLRRAGCKIPVVILTGSSDVAIKVRAFSGGADDYVVKPFHKDELTARLRAVIRRSSGHAESIITVGDIALNLDSRTVHVNGDEGRVSAGHEAAHGILALDQGGDDLTRRVELRDLAVVLRDRGLDVRQADEHRGAHDGDHRHHDGEADHQLLGNLEIVQGHKASRNGSGRAWRALWEYSQVSLKYWLRVGITGAENTHRAGSHRRRRSAPWRRTGTPATARRRQAKS